MDHWQLFTLSVLAFNFVAIAVIGAILTRAARRAAPRKPKRGVTPQVPKLNDAKARAIVKGEMHPLEAWRLEAGRSREGLCKISKISAETLSGVESRVEQPDSVMRHSGPP